MGIFNNKKSVVDSLRLEWGNDIKKDRDLVRLRQEFDSMKDPEDFYVDDQCWHDMEMDQHFTKMDRTRTYAGSLILYKMLRNMQLNVHKIKERGSQVEVIRQNQSLREQFQLAIFDLKHNNLEGILYFFDRHLFFPAIYRALSTVLAISPFAILAMIIWSGLQYIPLLVLNIVTNCVINILFAKYCLVNKGYFFSVRNLIVSASKLGKIHNDELSPILNELKDLSKKCHSIVKKTKGLEMVDKDLAGMAIYVDMILMITVRSFYRVVDHINENQEHLRDIYKKIGELDALIGMASYRENLQISCEPDFSDEIRFLRIEGAYQPLINHPVKNSISLKEQNVYLTGSNMSGKSTYLRTIGLCVLMAQTFNFAPCDRYEASFYKLYSSISRNDNLLLGKSYFLTEAEIVLNMLKHSHDEISSLIVIDEIFRGTNTKERIAASVGVLNYLAKQNAVVFVATHDLEIKNEIGDSFLNYHFGENIGENGIEFDYLLKPGNSKVGNALKILKFLGYPDEMFREEM